MSLKQLSTVVAVLGSIVLSACGGGGGSAGMGTDSPAPTPSAIVQGTAAKGLLLNAIVNFYPVSAGRAATVPVATVRTDAATGKFSAPVAASGPIVVVVTTDASTQMLDEVSGTVIGAPTGLTLHALLDGLVNLQPISVTPLTEMAFVVASRSTGGLTAANVDRANAVVSNVFLAGAPVLFTAPIDLKDYARSTVAQQEQAKFLTALAVAASRGTASGAGGSACTGDYAANIVCLVGGLGELVTLDSAATPVLGSSASYVAAAYRDITADAVRVNGGVAPSALGLNIPTAAESALLTAVGSQAPFPGGYNPNPAVSQADLIANTKALFANIRTNILDQKATQTFAYASTLTDLQNDFNNNAGPVLSNTANLVASAYEAAQLIQYGTTGSGGYGTPLPSPYLNGPYALAFDGTGNLYIANNNNTITKVTGGTNAATFAGQPGVVGSSDSPATFGQVYGMTVDKSGNLYVTDNFATLRKISPAGAVTTVAGHPGVYGQTNGPGGSATFNGIFGVVADAAGNVYVADYGNSVIRMYSPSSGMVSTYAGQMGVPGSADGNATTTATFACPSALAIDANANIYVTDDCNFNIRVISATAHTVTTLAGQAGIIGYHDAASGAGALFSNSIDSVALLGSELYVYDASAKAVRTIATTGNFAVSTLISAATQSGSASASTIGYLNGLAAAGGNLYAADYTFNTIQQITPAGAVATVAHASASYHKHCGYDPQVLTGGRTGVALCRYGKGSEQILLTVAQSAPGSNTYSVQTQGLALQCGTGPYNPITFCYVPVGSALPASFMLTTGSSGAQSLAFSGNYYVNSTGGQVNGVLNAAESSNWDTTTDSGSISLSGTLSAGSGGVSLVHAAIGSDSTIAVQNLSRLLYRTGSGIGSIAVAGTAPVSITGTLDLTDLTTSRYTYAVKAAIGSPLLDASSELALPGKDGVSITGAVTPSGASTPMFSGSISAGVLNLSAFDARQPVSATNNFTVEAQVSGTVNLPADGTHPARTLTVTASASGNQQVPTPANPDSMSVTYSYTTPTGTTELNATGQYDTTAGFSGTLNDNAGVLVTLKTPPGGSLCSGTAAPYLCTVTDNGVETATLSTTTTGLTINFVDGTTESVY